MLTETSNAYSKSNTPEKASRASQYRWAKQKRQQALLDSTQAEFTQQIKAVKGLGSLAIKQQVERGMLETAAIVGMKYVRDLLAGVKKTHQEAMTWGLFYDKVMREEEPYRVQNLVVNLFGNQAISQRLLHSTEGIEVKAISCKAQEITPDSCTILTPLASEQSENVPQAVDK